MDFGSEPKSHSISSETTFDTDLNEEYAIETAIMTLSMDVLFRMHKENVRSKTVMLKIRYEDFTTVSIQETQDRSIMNADDMFARCRSLFQRKYEKGRGVRLIGVACCNVEDRNLPDQQDLFDFGDGKKARVENAIYSMEQKNPKIKIKKARVLDSGS